MLEAMLAAPRAEGTFSDEEIKGNVLTLMIAGEDTTADALGSTVWLLASNPEAQDRLAAEAQQTLGEHLLRGLRDGQRAALRRGDIRAAMH